jgi:beta-phosphoglucomutase
MNEDKIIAIMFDVDGVIAETPHEESWRDIAIEWKIIPEKYNFTSFYAKHVAGEPGIIGAYNILSMLRYNGKSFFENEKIINEKDKQEVTKKFRELKVRKFIDSYIALGKYKEFTDITTKIKEANKQKTLIMAVSSSETAKIILEKFCLLNLFDTTALGTKTCWCSQIEKINHYAMAYGKLLEKSNLKKIEKVIVFEDAPKGIEAVNKLGFHAIGISRKSSSGINLATKEQLYSAGAKIVYDEKELNNISLNEIITLL